MRWIQNLYQMGSSDDPILKKKARHFIEAYTLMELCSVLALAKYQDKYLTKWKQKCGFDDIA